MGMCEKYCIDWGRFRGGSVGQEGYMGVASSLLPFPSLQFPSQQVGKWLLLGGRECKGLHEDRGSCQGMFKMKTM